MALRQLGLFQLNTDPKGREVDFGTPTNPLDEIFAGSVSADVFYGDGSNLTIEGLTSLIERVAVEETARVAGDSSLVTKMSNDVQLAITNLVDGAPAALDTLVEIATKIGDGTITEANIISEINSVAQRVTEEAATRLSADDSLATLVGQVSTGVSTQLSDEISTTNFEVSSLATRVSTEEVVRETAITSLTNEITGEVTADIDSVDDRALVIEGDVVSVETRLSLEEVSKSGLISDLDTQLTGDVASIDTAIGVESAARVDADDTLDSKISVESALRVDGDDSLETKIGEESALRVTADGSLETKISELEAAAYNDSSINERVGDSEDFSASLETRVSDEESLRAAKDLSLTLVDGLISSDLSTADESLTAKLNSAITTSLTGDSSLDTKIVGEASTRVVADDSLDSKIDSEVGTLSNDITLLGGQLTNEVNARTLGDNTLNTKIDTEVSTLESADA